MDCACVSQEDLRLAIELVKGHIDVLLANVGGVSCDGEKSVTFDNLLQAMSLIKGHVDEVVSHIVSTDPNNAAPIDSATINQILTQAGFPAIP